MANIIAPTGQVWVCGACGKRSRDLYGDQRISGGWDESCMLNACLVLESHLVFNNDGGMVIQVKDGGLVATQRSFDMDGNRKPDA